jgi:putative glutamine amidotransferase
VLSVLLTAEDGFDEAGQGHYVASKIYAEALARRGLLALTPVVPGLAREYAAFARGLVLSDGPEIHRAYFGGVYPEGEQATDVVRDEAEFALFDAVAALGKPILGIGRGANVISAALGGGSPGEHAMFFMHRRLPIIGVFTEIGSVCAERCLDIFADAVRRSAI